MAEQILNPWKVVIYNPGGGEAVELVTDPAEIPAVASGKTFTITWDAQRGTARFDLEDAE
jgi:hypothetical protein